MMILKNKRIRWKVLVFRRIGLLIGVFAASYVIEEVTHRSHVIGKGGELILTSIIDHFFFGTPVAEDTTEAVEEVAKEL